MLCLVGLCGLLPGSRFGMKNKWELTLTLTLALALALTLALALALTLALTLTLTLTLSLTLTQGGHAPVRPRLQRRVSGGAREWRGSVLHVRDAADPGPTRGPRRRRTCEAVR